MAEFNKAPRGTADVVPTDSYKWRKVEKVMLDTAGQFGFKEIRTPVFEHTEVFTKSVGDTTDVVQKEMYTFTDKGNRSITLRPELTAGAVRSVIENGLVQGVLPCKVCYIGSCYRYEKPQAGRLREFHQFGVECFGTASPNADAEVILLAKSVLNNLGVKDLTLKLNSIGCPKCRKEYHSALKEYFYTRKDELCETCLDRLERNPMRILDCKSPICTEISNGAPRITDYLCEECDTHFESVKSLLKSAGVEFEVDSSIVRGLDYYTKTVFEFVSNSIGAQGTVCGGGRYDLLVSQMGGPDTASLGFAMGIERLLLVLENSGIKFDDDDAIDLYIAPLGLAESNEAIKLADALRAKGMNISMDIVGRSVKATMKYANKINCKYSLIIGSDELNNNTANLQNMETGEKVSVRIDSEEIYKVIGIDSE